MAWGLTGAGWRGAEGHATICFFLRTGSSACRYFWRESGFILKQLCDISESCCPVLFLKRCRVLMFMCSPKRIGLCFEIFKKSDKASQTRKFRENHL